MWRVTIQYTEPASCTHSVHGGGCLGSRAAVAVLWRQGEARCMDAAPHVNHLCINNNNKIEMQNVMQFCCNKLT